MFKFQTLKLKIIAQQHKHWVCCVSQEGDTLCLLMMDMAKKKNRVTLRDLEKMLEDTEMSPVYPQFYGPWPE